MREPADRPRISPMWVWVGAQAGLILSQYVTVRGDGWYVLAMFVALAVLDERQGRRRAA